MAVSRQAVQSIKQFFKSLIGYNSIFAFMKVIPTLTNEDAVVSWAQNEAPDTIDALINNAGKLVNKPFAETTQSDFEGVFKVNVFGLANLTRALLKKLQPTGHVVNISSMGGIGGTSKFPGLTAYSSSKGAVSILTELLAEEFKERMLVNEHDG